eukprot:3302562-Pyramimonas_sp.AAC.1
MSLLGATPRSLSVELMEIGAVAEGPLNHMPSPPDTDTTLRSGLPSLFSAVHIPSQAAADAALAAAKRQREGG